jgi:ADP-ribose pyrophosphatase YjhB (NUDIX family)
MGDEHYKKQDHLLVAIDCVIFGFDRSGFKVLLIEHDFKSKKEDWSLIGGFVKKNESLDAAAVKITNKITGLRDIYLEQICTLGDVNRDPLERTISVAYYALIDIDSYDEELVKQYNASWFSINEIPDLILDHNKMVDAALKKLRFKASHQPVGFELLPFKFTLPDLQKLYEGIYNTRLDKRNFRRRILSLDVLVKTNEKEKEHSKKGAYLYKFDQEKYKKKVNKGDSLIFKPMSS